LNALKCFYDRRDHIVVGMYVKPNEFDRIGGVMVSVLAPSAVDHGFELRSGQTKD